MSGKHRQVSDANGSEAPRRAPPPARTRARSPSNEMREREHQGLTAKLFSPHTQALLSRVGSKSLRPTNGTPPDAGGGGHARYR